MQGIAFKSQLSSWLTPSVLINKGRQSLTSITNLQHLISLPYFTKIRHDHEIATPMLFLV